MSVEQRPEIEAQPEAHHIDLARGLLHHLRFKRVIDELTQARLQRWPPFRRQIPGVDDPAERRRPFPLVRAAADRRLRGHEELNAQDVIALGDFIEDPLRVEANP